VHFMTWWCDDSSPQPPVLLEYGFQYKQIPACLTFSLEKNYLLWFVPEWTANWEYLFTIRSPKEWRIYDAYPLYRTYLWSLYYALVFRDKDNNRLTTLYAQWNEESYTMRVERHNMLTWNKDFELVVTDWNQLLAQTPKEKMFVYLYKEWDRYKWLYFPWIRYQFFTNPWWWTWNKINEWPLYSLPIWLYAPRKDKGSTFTFKVTMEWNRLYIDDTLKITSFDVTRMGTSIEVEDRPERLDQPDICRRVKTEIYADAIGDTVNKRTTKMYPMIVWEWWNASTIKIFHNGKSQWTIPDQHYQWYVYHRLWNERGNLVLGNNVYTIKAYDQRGTEICTKDLSIEVVAR
jgi:hypothetical protein